MKSAQELATLAAYGGGFSISAANYRVQELCNIAGFAANGNAKITVKSCDHLTANDLNRIAGFGKGAIFFEFSA
ncbi:hypothetical protein [Ralstonia pseudosolanacearum]|uniref:hypothetical protein n=1 Tax=Ralstonia pseudosolanacearum TaxID=1310165 RepID=UPI0013F4EBB8|nr:hypothetical protein G7968_12785 [Ralstonia solanacearum]